VLFAKLFARWLMDLEQHREGARRVERAYELRQFYRRLKGYGLIVFLVVLALGTGLFWKSDLGQELDRWVLRQFFVVRGTVPHPDDIIIVAIDNAMLERHGGGFPRRVFAEGMEMIARASPKLVVIDATFSKDHSDRDADRRIARAIASVPSVIGAGRFYTGQGGTKDYITLGSDQIFQEAARFELPMTFRADNFVVEHITFNPALDLPLSERIPLSPALSEFFDLAVLPGPFDLINYYGQPGSINRVTLQELIENDLAFTEKKIKERAVFIGFQSAYDSSAIQNTEEFFISASSRPMYGVEVHATIAGNLIDRSWIKRMDPVFTISLVALLSAVMFCILITLPLKKGYLLIFSSLITLTVLNYLLFSWYRIWIGGVATLWLVSVGGIILVAFWTEHSLRKTKKRIEKYWGREI